jgi:outer membrane lipoprotein carrier protein
VPSALGDRLDEILSEMAQAGERLKTLEARFDQNNHDHILDMDEAASGRLYVKLPGNIRWEYEPPSPKVLLVAGDKIRLFNPTSNQVQEFEKGQMRGGGADLLIGFGKSNAEIGKNYDVSLVEENETTVVLELIPKPDSTASLFKAIELTMEKQRWVPVRSLFHELNRDTTEILFKEMKVNEKLPPKAFDLDLPPDVEIIRNK